MVCIVYLNSASLLLPASMNIHLYTVRMYYYMWILIETQNLNLLMCHYNGTRKENFTFKQNMYTIKHVTYLDSKTSLNFSEKMHIFHMEAQNVPFLSSSLVSDCLTFYSTHFVCFVWSANNFAQKQKRKTLTAPDVFEALEEMEFEQFIKPLKESLECEYPLTHG